MSDAGYKIRDQSAIHFVTFAVVGWVDVFTRQDYRDTVVQSLKYCEEEKGLVIYAWCLMSNHIHLIISAANHNLSDVLGDFKKFTSRKIISDIENHPGESRKEWMLDIFSKAGDANSRNKNYQFWQQDNRPMILFTPKFALQKMVYIHNNPVAAGIVEKAEEYIYSSARDYYYGKNCGLIKIEFLEF